MFAKVNETRLFFDVDGKQVVYDKEAGCMKEKPVCFVLHGGPGGDHNIYGTFFHWLTEYMQLVYIDYRGNGRSDYPDESTYTMDQNAEDLEALRQYLGLNKIVVMGQSYGGIMSQCYATKYPENVCGAILICTAPSYKLMGGAVEELKKRGTPEMMEFFKKNVMAGGFKDNETWRNYLKMFAGMYTLHPENAQKYIDEIDNCVLNYKAVNMGSAELATYNFIPDLHKITCPTLLIGGQQDWICPISCTHEISDEIPDCTTVIIEDSSHEVFLDQTQITHDALDTFVRERIAPLAKLCK